MKTAVITGSGRGIGLATVQKFLDNGWRVIGTRFKSPTSIVHPQLMVVEYDQSNPESIKAAAEEIAQKIDRVDVLVNAAGVILDAHNQTADVAKIRQTLEVDLLGVIDFTERLIPLMTEGSHIVNIDSMYGSFSMPIDDESSTGYRIAKAGLNMYTRALAFRLKSSGIIVSSIDPGWVKTDMGNDVADDAEKPDRTPGEAAADIYNLVSSVKESGFFWQFDKKRDW